MRPYDLPSLETFRERHGTRSCYVAGCRCDECRAANRRRMHDRGLMAIELVEALPYLPPVEVWRRGGNTRWSGEIISKNGCPGIDDRGCVFKSAIRKDSINGRCEKCRLSLVWDGIVDAAPARRHLNRLARQGVGRRGISDACDVPHSTLHSIRKGRKKRIRRSTEKAILGVTAELARGDKSLVPAGRTMQRLASLQEEGFTKSRIAAMLGSKAKTPSLQIKWRRSGTVTARTAMKVEKLHRAIQI